MALQSLFSDWDGQSAPGNDLPLGDPMEVEEEERERMKPVQISFPGAGQVLGVGKTYMDDFNNDRFAHERLVNLYYPFASRPEWETANFLLNSPLSMREIDQYLKLELTKKNNLSFNTAKKLQERADLLPEVPRWKYRTIKTLPLYPSKVPLVLYYRDAVECLQDLMKSPLIQDSLSFTPLQIFKTSEKVVQIFESWLSGDRAWNMQSQLPKGGTLLGAILSSDKTTISVITGNRVAHPLLISLANIDTSLLSKASLHLFSLLALLPIPKYIDKRTTVRSVLEARLFHECLNIVIEPLKIAARIGRMMSDPVGQLRACFIMLASYIVDTPEASMVSCVGGGGKTSPYSMAIHTDYGDMKRHPPRLSGITLNTIDSIEADGVLPQDIPAYYRESRKKRTNGVENPFWADWPLSEPCEFLTPEPLHHWHKMFWDHDLKWCIQATGAQNLDFLFSIVQPTVGYRRFKEGVASLKQVTGRTHRDVQRYLIPLISGVVSAKFAVALRALQEIRYAAQAPRFSTSSLARIQTTLDEFHLNKEEILTLKARVNPKGEPINNWEIPKLEFLQNIVPSISASGPIMQWTADMTEHAHIDLVKDPARSGNNHAFEIQICRGLDRASRIRRFDLMTAMKDANVDFRLDNNDVEGDEGDEEAVPETISSTEDLVNRLKPVSGKIFGSFRFQTNFFLQSHLLSQNPNAAHPYRIFSEGETAAFSLKRDADLKTMKIDEASILFSLPGFRSALGDYLKRCNQGITTFRIVGRRESQMNCELPFNKISVWSKMRIQAKTYFNVDLVNDPHTIFAAPPGHKSSDIEWPFGRYDCAVVNLDPQFEWPRSSLEGAF
ncbi:hypothetical protein BDP27DRAFT_1440698 [Rhodocollybia butyracea]|uniref:DUF6830 domain-containing protein n=1 Tax=Rhodocollybia butyracea TaxID=206335 RepID=A0A9P5NZM6_9AGAR|nr:hypothetical protein BDP27DRAFT_1440698 [Rhodocollybia butyracea]